MISPDPRRKPRRIQAENPLILLSRFSRPPLAALLLRGIPITWDYAWPFAITVSVVTAVVILFDQKLWRLPIFKRWLVRQPNVRGTWHVTLQSDWKDPGTGAGIDPIECVMVIRQTFSKISLRLFTTESSSLVLAGKIVEQDDGVFEIAAVYQNTPSVHLRGQRSEIHHGALLLEIQSDPARVLNGHYWTDRLTKGSLRLADRRDCIVSNYEEGAALYRLNPQVSKR